MKKWLIVVGVLAFFQASGPSSVLADTQWEVGFTSNSIPDNCSQIIVRHIDEAKKTVLVQAYSFTSYDIAEALLRASLRVVQVQVILDFHRWKEINSQAIRLIRGKIPVWLDSQHPIAHNKIMVIDGEMVITGSYNFTEAAERNAENLLVFKDPQLAKRYTNHWNFHRGHSKRAL